MDAQQFQAFLHLLQRNADRLTLPRFSGDGSDKRPFCDWIVQYDYEATQRGWDDAQKAANLGSYLSYPSFRTYSHASDTVRQNYEELKKVLAQDSGESARSAKALAEMHALSQSASESVIEFANRVKNTIRLAYPTRKDPDLEILMTSTFLRGLKPNFRRDALRISNSELTIQDYVKEAVNAENVELAERTFASGQQFPSSTEQIRSIVSSVVSERLAALNLFNLPSTSRSVTQPSPRPHRYRICEYCRHPNHFWSNCRFRKRDKIGMIRHCYPKEHHRHSRNVNPNSSYFASSLHQKSPCSPVPKDPTESREQQGR